MKSRKLVSLILAVMMTVMLFAGCTSQTAQTPSEPQKPAEQPAETPKADKILKFGGTGFGGLFNPIMSDNTYDTYVADSIFEKLVTNDADGEMIPVLAEWTISEDKLTYTFTLKDGIKFSDGSDLTTEDVAFTYETIAHPDYNGPRAYAVSSL